MTACSAPPIKVVTMHFLPFRIRGHGVVVLIMKVFNTEVFAWEGLNL